MAALANTLARRREQTIAHMNDMGYNQIQYYAWCRAHHVKCSLTKTAIQLRREKRMYIEEMKDAMLHRITPTAWSWGELVDHMIDCRIRSLHDLNGSQAELVNAYWQCKKRTWAATLLRVVAERSRLLEADFSRQAVINLFGHGRAVLRDVQLWQPRFHGRERQFMDLVRYLYARYPVSPVLENGWWEPQEVPHDWYLFVARGGNLLRAPQFPKGVTKRMAHYALQAPKVFCMAEALVYAQATLDGAAHIWAKRLAESDLGRWGLHVSRHTGEACSKRWLPFWQSVLRSLVPIEPISLSKLDTLLGYLRELKFGNTRIGQYGVQEFIEPAQPGLTMKGRCVSNLLDAAQRWQASIAQESRNLGGYWEHSAFHDHVFMDGDKPTWRLRELLSASALRREGHRMNHCVVTYVRDCLSGRATIWSLERCDKGHWARHLTLEVNPQTKRVVQVRGSYNRIAEKDELAVVKEWALAQSILLPDSALRW